MRKNIAILCVFFFTIFLCNAEDLFLTSQNHENEIKTQNTHIAFLLQLIAKSGNPSLEECAFSLQALQAKTVSLEQNYTLLLEQLERQQINLDMLVQQHRALVTEHAQCRQDGEGSEAMTGFQVQEDGSRQPADGAHQEVFDTNPLLGSFSPQVFTFGSLPSSASSSSSVSLSSGSSSIISSDGSPLSPFN